MDRSRRILVVVSAHGFGHLAQTAPLANALAERAADLELHVWSSLPEPRIKARITTPFGYRCLDADVGMIMRSAMEVDVEASARAYRTFHERWPARVDRMARDIAALAPELVLADVPYLPLAAAARAEIASLALCSLNWLDIYRHYCGNRRESGAIMDAMHAAYLSAGHFLKPLPSMPMRDLANARAIGPIAEVGADRRAALDAQLELAAESRLVLVAYGGTPLELPLARWPHLPDVRWIVPTQDTASRPDMIPFEALEMPFIDVLRSCDAVLGKPGYGTFAEAACNATAVLYTRRPDWPEDSYLVHWLEGVGASREISREQLLSGDFAPALTTLLEQAPHPAVRPSGIDDACRIIGACLHMDHLR